MAQSFGTELIAGTAGGVASIIVCHPLDTIRVRLQTDQHGRFKGVSDVVRQTIHKEGLRAFYKGFSAPLFSQAITKATMFVSRSASMKFLYWSGSAQPHKPLFIYQLAACGAVAGVTNSFISCPIELIRCNLQIQYEANRSESIYRGPIQCAREIVRNHGFFALWRGIIPMIFRDVPGIAAFFAGFEIAKRYLVSRFPDSNSLSNPSLNVLMSAGAFGGVSYWIFAFPQDVIKSIVQTRFANQQRLLINANPGPIGVSTVNGNISNDGFISVAKELWQKDPKRFYRGFSVSFFRGIPGASITFTAHHYTSIFLTKKR